MRKRMGAALAVAVLAASPARADTCWTNVAYEAAQIRDFETMMMVSMLRCRLVGNDFTETYNRFIRANRPLLDGANRELQAQFAKTVGSARAMGAYDDYMTKVANGYGGGNDGLSCRDFSSIADAAVSQAANRENLVALADRAGSRPALPGMRCGLSVAMKQP